MRKVILGVVVLVFIGCGALPALADSIVLQDAGFNVNGTPLFIPGPQTAPVGWPAIFNTGGFNFVNGLGTISINYNPGPGSYSIIEYLDHDIVGPNNPVNNETGATSGTPAAGQSWEIDEPGFTTGDLVSNVLAGALDNSLGGPGTTFPNDVAIGLGWNFTLTAGQSAILTFVASTTAPTSGFFLQQSDPNGMQIFDSSTLTINSSTPPTVPEPISLVLLGSAFVALGITTKSFRRQGKISTAS